MPIRENNKGACEVCGKPGQPMEYKGILCEKHGAVKYNSGMKGRKVGKKELIKNPPVTCSGLSYLGAKTASHLDNFDGFGQL